MPINSDKKITPKDRILKNQILIKYQSPIPMEKFIKTTSLLKNGR